mmetsp:Transcript_36885/g.92492  ORF Transcript_36885/g.92492 Transcript_36885/m.92492 type:complete len:265 (+) Transcript_36885:778-1572(+)
MGPRWCDTPRPCCSHTHMISLLSIRLSLWARRGLSQCSSSRRSATPRPSLAGRLHPGARWCAAATHYRTEPTSMETIRYCSSAALAHSRWAATSTTNKRPSSTPGSAPPVPTVGRVRSCWTAARMPTVRPRRAGSRRSSSSSRCPATQTCSTTSRDGTRWWWWGRAADSATTSTGNWSAAPVCSPRHMPSPSATTSRGARHSVRRSLRSAFGTVPCLCRTSGACPTSTGRTHHPPRRSQSRHPHTHHNRQTCLSEPHPRWPCSR